MPRFCITLLSLTWIRDTDREKLVDHVADDLNGVVAFLIDDGIPDEEATASLCRRTSYLWVVLAQVRQNAVTYELVEYVT